MPPPGRTGRSARPVPTRPSRSDRSSSRSAMTWMTSPSRCTRPWQASMLAVRISRRCRSNTDGPDDQVGDPGLVLDGDEVTPRRAAGPLPDQHDAGHRHAAAVARAGEIGAGDHAGWRSSARRNATGWRAQAQAACCGNPRPLRRLRSSAPARTGGSASSGSGGRPRSAAANSGSAAPAQAADRPQRLPAVQPEAPKASASARRSSAAAGTPARRHNSSTPPYGGLPRAGRRSQAACAFARPFTIRKPSRTARMLPTGRLQRAVPARGVDADRPDLDAVRAGIAHDLRRRVEPHRLRVQQGGSRTRPGGGTSARHEA